MAALKNVAIATLAAMALPSAASAATLGGFYYAPQYDYREFFAATDGKTFRVVLAGTPFPGIPTESVAGPLLAQMQVAKPQPNLTFTYDVPAEKPRPDYRLVLLFDVANDFGSTQVCAGDKPRFKPPAAPGRFKLYAVYCRNDLALSETTAWTDASDPNDPRVGELFRELFAVVFNDSMTLRPQSSGNMR